MGEPFPYRRGDDHGRDGDRNRMERGRGEMRASYDREGDFPRGRETFRRDGDDDRSRRPERSPSPLPDFNNRAIRWSGWDKPVSRFGSAPSSSPIHPPQNFPAGGMFPQSDARSAPLSAPLPVASSSSSVPRQQKRLYVGNLPPQLNEAHFVDFLNAGMRKVPGATLGEDEATFFTAFDGMTYSGHSLRIHRPREWQPTGAEPPLPNVPQSALGIISTTVPDGPNKIFIGGLPTHFNEAEVKEILTAIGPLKAFNLVRDAAGNSKGFAFCEYVDPELTDVVCQSFNGRKYGDRTLVVQRSQPGQKGATSASGQANAFNPAQGNAGYNQFSSDDARRNAFARGDDSASAASQLQQQGMPKIITNSDGMAILDPEEMQAKTDGENTAMFSHLLNSSVPTDVLTNTVVSRAKERTEVLQPTTILVLLNAVDTTEEWTDEYFNAVCQDMWNEASKYGQIVNLVVPRAPPKPKKKRIYAMPGELSDADIGSEGRKQRDAEPVGPPPPPGHGRVYVQFGSIDHARAALSGMAGRKYDGRMLLSSFAQALPASS